MSMLHLVCERCGFQVFVEHRYQAIGWHFKTADSPSLCPACVADTKLVESTAAPDVNAPPLAKPDVLQAHTPSGSPWWKSVDSRKSLHRDR
jgi:hypothetical protein